MVPSDVIVLKIVISYYHCQYGWLEYIVVVFVRIVDNLPITWCYLTENSQTYCSTGFPIGCYNKKVTGSDKDMCSYLVITFTCLFTCI